MLLGEELERAIEEAWVSLRRRILSDPDELRRRLARRRMKSLIRPPRAWCIAVRASDRRITPAHWVIWPEHAVELDHPLHPYEPIEHEVFIGTHALLRYCRPVRLGLGEEVGDVARRLGVSEAMLWRARSRGVFDEQRYSMFKGKRGRPIPLIHTREVLDPGFGNFYRRPHEVWGSMWGSLVEMVPEDFEQGVRRRPVFRWMGSGRRKRTGDGANGRWGERPAEIYKDEMQHIGWRWVCPSCKKEVRTIYYPMPVRTLFDCCWFVDPAIQLKLSDADQVQEPPATFACAACHDVQYFSTVEKGFWNKLIFCLTGGMLYGSEVKRPAELKEERRRVRVRRIRGDAPVRGKVLARLRNGWSDFAIAKELGKSLNAVRCQVYRICREEEVSDRQALAEKLEFAVSPPLNQEERAGARRFAVKEMLLLNCSHREMMEKLCVGRDVLKNDIRMIYRMYGVKGFGHKARRALAEKMGVGFVTKGEEIAKKVGEMRERGMKWKEIAGEMGESGGRLRHLWRREGIHEDAQRFLSTKGTKDEGSEDLKLET